MDRQGYKELALTIDWRKVSQGQWESVETVNSLLLFLTGRPLRQFCSKCVSDAYYIIQEFIKDEQVHTETGGTPD